MGKILVSYIHDAWYQKLVKNLTIGILGGLAAVLVVWFVSFLAFAADSTLGLTLLAGVVTGTIGGLIGWGIDMIPHK